MEVLLTVQIEELPEGGYLATSAELPGLVAEGRTAAETLEIAQDVRPSCSNPTGNTGTSRRAS